MFWFQTVINFLIDTFLLAMLCIIHHLLVYLCNLNEMSEIQVF